MAFTLSRMCVLAYGNGFTLWHYRSRTDRMSDISRAGYFNEAGEMLQPADMILVAATDGGTCLLVNDATLGSVKTTSLSFGLAPAVSADLEPAWDRGDNLASLNEEAPHRETTYDRRDNLARLNEEIRAASVAHVRTGAEAAWEYYRGLRRARSLLFGEAF